MKKLIILFSIITIIISYFYIADSFYKKGNEDYKNKNYNSAIENYERAIKLTPTKNIIYYNLGIVYYEMKYYDKSIENYNKFISLSPDLENVKIDLFKIKDDIENNFESLDYAESYSYYLTWAYVGLGYSKYYEGKYAESIENYTIALKILEKYKSIYLHIYDVYKKENIIEEVNIYKDKISKFESNIDRVESDIKESKRLLD